MANAFQYHYLMCTEYNEILKHALHSIPSQANVMHIFNTRIVYQACMHSTLT